MNTDPVVGLVVLISFLAILTVAVLWAAVVIVPQDRARVVERLGRFQRVLAPGMHLIVPWVDRAPHHVDLRERRLVVGPTRLVTADNREVGYRVEIGFQVTDPHTSVYAVADVPTAIGQLTETALRAAVGGIEADKVRDSRSAIEEHVAAALDDTAGSWGVRIVWLQSDPPPRPRQPLT